MICARHKVSKVDVKGTFEKLDATAGVDWMPDGHGGYTYEHNGNTEIWWDTMTTQEKAPGVTLFLLEDGTECTLDDIEFYDDEADEDFEGVSGELAR